MVDVLSASAKNELNLDAALLMYNFNLFAKLTTPILETSLHMAHTKVGSEPGTTYATLQELNVTAEAGSRPVLGFGKASPEMCHCILVTNTKQSAFLVAFKSNILRKVSSMACTRAGP